MKILLTGGNGQLGKELKKFREFIAPRSMEFDITNEDQVIKGLYLHKPDLIVHSAAYTNGLLPESDPEEAYKCYKTNVLGTLNLVRNALCPIIHISTELAVHPYNFYAITKVQAENEVRKHFAYRIIRTSFRFNPFEYDKAPTDMLTIGDYAEVIAPLINHTFDLPCTNEITYIGTGAKSVYDLAKQTRPGVTPVSFKDLPYPLAPMSELLSI